MTLKKNINKKTKMLLKKKSKNDSDVISNIDWLTASYKECVSSPTRRKKGIITGCVECDVSASTQMMHADLR